MNGWMDEYTCVQVCLCVSNEGTVKEKWGKEESFNKNNIWNVILVGEMRLTFTCCPSLKGYNRKGTGWLLLINCRACIGDKFTPFYSEIIPCVPLPWCSSFVPSGLVNGCSRDSLSSFHFWSFGFNCGYRPVCLSIKIICLPFPGNSV